MRRLPLILLFAPVVATADDVTLGYLVSPPIARSGTGVVHAATAGWEREITPRVAVGVGIEVGASGGEQGLARVALLPGVAVTIGKLGVLDVRIEEQFGWQIVRGRLTLDGIPLRGIETRGFHNELALAVDAQLTSAVDLRARVGFVIDGIYPAGHASTRAGPFIGIAAVIHL